MAVTQVKKARITNDDVCHIDKVAEFALPLIFAFLQVRTMAESA